MNIFEVCFGHTTAAIYYCLHFLTLYYISILIFSSHSTFLIIYVYSDSERHRASSYTQHFVGGFRNRLCCLRCDCSSSYTDSNECIVRKGDPRKQATAAEQEKNKKNKFTCSKCSKIVSQENDRAWQNGSFATHVFRADALSTGVL